MDINGINSKDSADALEHLKMLQANPHTSKPDAKKEAEELTQADSYDSESFTAIKSEIAQAEDAARTKYLEKIKKAVEQGSYNISSDLMADAILADGYGEFLVS